MGEPVELQVLFNDCGRYRWRSRASMRRSLHSAGIKPIGMSRRIIDRQLRWRNVYDADAVREYASPQPETVLYDQKETT